MFLDVFNLFSHTVFGQFVGRVIGEKSLIFLTRFLARVLTRVSGRDKKYKYGVQCYPA